MSSKSLDGWKKEQVANEMHVKSAGWDEKGRRRIVWGEALLRWRYQTVQPRRWIYLPKKRENTLSNA